ncbi:hypothetical protein PHYSODRAFT_297618 [Phytophthora sojae]|uniref:DUF659 domain-containing protein n=1 Tax=Phytophthora sojae (strain P6497) TaxID=1094619 RepID=G4YZR7_PHYSP|nr:hypothetical protein PHYSODRAFT_297618 [Phytophthora sojae]EGZ26292.1 hypothetical protein PHYSODRAFT_297618 [Phytophthora sojae]|eukprot:XP_009521580.1 hypothetical protein PHYSODRAFT_297618 [Phytophthora sojae]
MDLLPELRDEQAGASKRGRSPSALSTNFYRLNEKMQQDDVADATIPFPTHVHGRKEAWEKHLAGCVHYVGAIGNVFQSVESEGEPGEHGRTTKSQSTSPPEFTLAEKLLRLLVFLNARCGVPGAMRHRHLIGGRVLDEYADLHSVEQRDNVRSVQNRSGGKVNFLSDVWETIAKMHVLGCMASLFGRVMTYGLRPAGDRHDGIAIAQQMEGVLEELLASECGRARRILALRYPNIAFVYCFAHDINNLAKAVLKTVFKQVSDDAAGAAGFFNTSTSKWLACFASLLRARGALKDMVFSYRNSSELTDKLRVLGDAGFWAKLQSAEEIARPLCATSFRLQRDEKRVLM